MPRMVRHELNGPIKIEPQDKPIFVCGCGLSAKFPLCDGTHKACKNEPVGVVSVYGPDKRTIVETLPDAAGPDAPPAPPAPPTQVSPPPT